MRNPFATVYCIDCAHFKDNDYQRECTWHSKPIIIRDKVTGESYTDNLYDAVMCRERRKFRFCFLFSPKK